MLSRSALSRTAPRALRPSYSVAGASSHRGLASATPSLQYETSEAAGIKIANREVGGPTMTLALVTRAGPRYQPFPGFSEALEHFAFKVRCNTH
jgi:ubiquinol-cytochrome c reductase core subunit 2